MVDTAVKHPVGFDSERVVKETLMHLPDHEPNDPLAAWVGVRNLLLIYIVVAAVVVISWRAWGQEQGKCDHPVGCLTVEHDGSDLAWKTFHC